MAQVASKPMGMTAPMKLRVKVISGVIAYFVLTRLREQMMRRKENLSRKGGAVVDPNVGKEVIETAKVHGVETRFTLTGGGKADFSMIRSLEFWMPIVLKLVEFHEYKTYGSDITRLLPPLQRGVAFFYAVFGFIPLMELLFAEDWTNPTKQDCKEHDKGDIKFKLPLYLWTILELSSTFFMIKEISDPNGKMSLGNKIGAFILMAIYNGGIGITTSHELIHKKTWLDTFLGYALLMNVNYMHWGEEHLTGHHENVATPEDPATSKFGQSVYEFLPQTYIGSFISSNKLEQDRLASKDAKDGVPERKGIWKYLRYDNRIIYHIVIPMVWAKLIAKVTGNGWKAVGVFYLQAFFSASMLEVINYVEHYGLLREKLPNGKYEPVDPTHSWNSPHRISNALLFKLQRHSDHHTYAMRPYQLLRNFKESPQLPTGYPGMFVLALVPPAYFWVMDPLVKAHNENKDRLIKEAIANNQSDYQFEKSEDLIAAEKLAKSRLTKFIVG